VILLDTGPLVALCDERDAHHGRALTQLDRLRSRKLVASLAILSEACFLLDAAPLRARLFALLTRLDVDDAPDEHGRAFRDALFPWLARYADHQPDLADGCLAILASRVPGAKVWTFDSEFATTWRLPDGGRIPLAFPPPVRKRRRRA
jgi:predicted nucleic acid-binding protein